MASMLPASFYGLKVPTGGLLMPATIFPGTIRITMAAIDPSAEPQNDSETKSPRATLRLVRESTQQVLDEDDSDYDDMDDDSIEAIKARLGIMSEDEDGSEDDDSEDEKNGGPSDPVKAKKAKEAAFQKKLKEDLESEEMEIDSLTNGTNGTKTKGKGRALDDDDDDEIASDDEDAEAEDFVLCTLDSDKHYQQTLDITIGEDEDVGFIVTGAYDVYLTGNYVLPPDDEDFRDDEDDSEDEDEGLLGYDLSPDEDELDDEVSDSEEDALDGLKDPRVTEVGSDEEDDAPQLVEAAKKGKNKRPADSSGDEDEKEDVSLDALITKAMKKEIPATNGQQNGEQKLSKKQAKKLKKNDGQAAPVTQESAKKEAPSSDKKKVQFAKNLELGPTGSPKVDEKKETPAAKTGPRNVNGVSVEDKKVGKGKTAKKGDRIEMRYIGKLKNGKQFDANKKGKPFSFKLGVGEVIKGWDIGVVGMAPGGERRLTIPAKLAYGSKALPDIPANSDLVFDIKCMAVH